MPESKTEIGEIEPKPYRNYELLPGMQISFPVPEDLTTLDLAQGAKVFFLGKGSSFDTSFGYKPSDYILVALKENLASKGKKGIRIIPTNIPFILGRDLENQNGFDLMDSRISRSHVEIIINDDPEHSNISIKDLKSTNGTRVSVPIPFGETR